MMHVYRLTGASVCVEPAAGIHDAQSKATSEQGGMYRMTLWYDGEELLPAL